MLEDLKNFYANTFNYKGEATAHEVYNPLIATAALGILFAIANSFVQGFVAKWVVGFITAVWGIATLLAFTSIGVRRVGWMRRSVVPLVVAALCAVLGAALWFIGYGVPWLLGGVLRPLWGYSGAALAAFGAVVWLAWVLPSRHGVAKRIEHRKTGKPSKPAKSKTPRHEVTKQTDKGRHVAGGATNEPALQQGRHVTGVTSQQTTPQQPAPQGIQRYALQATTRSTYDEPNSSNSGLLTL